MTGAKNIVLVVTGSVAACKTAELVESLQKSTYAVDVIFTKAPEQWQDKPRWIPIETVRRITARSVLTDGDPLEAKTKIIQQADAILVAPASADFISQLSFGSSDFAKALVDAHRGGAALIVAPAMNYKIWEHPTVQRNCAALVERGGVSILGPVEGLMACNDRGYGRMMTVEEIVDSLPALLNGATGTVSASYALARKAAQQKAALNRPEPQFSMLAVIAGDDMEWKEIEEFVAEAQAEGLSARYILDQKGQRYREALEKMIGQTVITDHYQNDPQGLEHIRLPEQARYVVFPFVDKKLAQQMLEGATRTLSMDIYIASKAPVAVIPLRRAMPEASMLTSLSEDGVLVIKNLQELKR